jgi:hypothetical protein
MERKMASLSAMIRAPSPPMMAMAMAAPIREESMMLEKRAAPKMKMMKMAMAPRAMAMEAEEECKSSAVL